MTPSTTACSPGTVVLVRFPFTTLEAHKKRPAVVVSPTAYADSIISWVKAVWLAFALTVTCAAAAMPPLPDFVVESLGVGSETIVQGRPLAVTAVVKNQGSAAGDARHLDVWYHWTNDVAPAFGDVGDSWVLVGRLAAGESRSVVLPPQFLDHAGTNRLCARVEFENLVSESVNTNNHLCIEYVAKPVGTLLSPVHRFWSDQYGAHFYVMGDSERDRIAAKYPGVWRYETVAWYAYPVLVSGTLPVHRFWSDRLGKHFYIMGDSERDRIAAKYQGIWRYEAVAWHAYQTQVAGTQPVGRFWSDQFMGHFYTITQAEINRIAAKYLGIWNYETVAYWAFLSPPARLQAETASVPSPSGLDALSPINRLEPLSSAEVESTGRGGGNIP